MIRALLAFKGNYNRFRIVDHSGSVVLGSNALPANNIKQGAIVCFVGLAASAESSSLLGLIESSLKQ